MLIVVPFKKFLAWRGISNVESRHKKIHFIIYICHEKSNDDQRIKKLFYSIVWQLWERVINIPILLRLDNGLDFIAEPTSGNSTGTIYSRIYEYRIISFARNNIKLGGTLCDVGRNTGLYTLLIAPLFKRGFCFEPAESTYSLLIRNLALNQLFNFTPLDLAISDKIEKQYFISDSNYSRTAHLVHDK